MFYFINLQQKIEIIVETEEKTLADEVAGLQATQITRLTMFKGRNSFVLGSWLVLTVLTSWVVLTGLVVLSFWVVSNGWVFLTGSVVLVSWVVSNGRLVLTGSVDLGFWVVSGPRVELVNRASSSRVGILGC